MENGITSSPDPLGLHPNLRFSVTSAAKSGARSQSRSPSKRSLHSASPRTPQQKLDSTTPAKSNDTKQDQERQQDSEQRMSRPNTRSKSTVDPSTEPDLEDVIAPRKKGRSRTATPRSDSKGNTPKTKRTPAKKPAKGRKSNAATPNQPEEELETIAEEPNIANKNAVKPLQVRPAILIPLNDASPAAAKKIRERIPTPGKAMLNATSNTDDTNLWSEAGSIEADDTVAFDKSLAESEEFTMVSIESLRTHHREQGEEHVGSGPHAQENNRHEPPSTSITPNWTNSSPPNAAQSPRDEAQGYQGIASVFRGFGDATRRGLQAGLAMGELLGRGAGRPSEQSIVTPTPDQARLPTPAESVKSSSGAEQHGETLQEPDRRDYDQMSWEPTNVITNSRPSNASPPNIQHDLVERETTQDEATADAQDIWQEEAVRSGKKVRRTLKRKAAREPTGETLDFQELFGEDNRPNRAKIPKTWRRSSGSDFLYSDEADQQTAPETAQESPFNFNKQFPRALETPSRARGAVDAGIEVRSSPQKEVRFDTTPHVSSAEHEEDYPSSDESIDSVHILSAPYQSDLRQLDSTTDEIPDEEDMSEDELDFRIRLRRYSMSTPEPKLCKFRAYRAPASASEYYTHLHYLFPPLLTRIASYFPFTAAAQAVVQTKPYPSAWNRNHEALLQHFIRLSIYWLHNNQPAPSATNVRLDKRIPPPSPAFTKHTLPSHLCGFVGWKLYYHRDKYVRFMSEGDVRVAWAFVLEARERGIPQIVDPEEFCGESAMTEAQKKEFQEWKRLNPRPKYPLVASPGEAVRIKEDWAVGDVLNGVYMLYYRNLISLQERMFAAQRRQRS